MTATAKKNVEKQSVKFDRKRMEKALKSKQVNVPDDLSREEIRALILSHA